MATIFTDTFTGADGTAITSHTPDTGTSWTNLIRNGGGDMEIATGGATLDCGGIGLNEGALYTADATYDSANYYTQVTAVNADSGDDWCWLAVRIQDASNMYACQFNNDSCQLYKTTTGGGWVTVGTAGAGVANGSVAKLDITGTTLTFYDDGVSVKSETVSDHSSAGKAGLGVGYLFTSTDDGSTQEFDNFSVVTTGGGSPVVQNLATLLDVGI